MEKYIKFSLKGIKRYQVKGAKSELKDLSSQKCVRHSIYTALKLFCSEYIYIYIFLGNIISIFQNFPRLFNIKVSNSQRIGCKLGVFIALEDCCDSAVLNIMIPYKDILMTMGIDPL